MELLPLVCEYATLTALRRLHQALGGDAALAATLRLAQRGAPIETALECYAHRRLARDHGDDTRAAVCWGSDRLLLLDND